jgi:hypothetical protein
VLEVLHSSKVSVRVSGEGDDVRCDEFEAMLPSKTESWCGDLHSKICSQLTHDGIGLSVNSCTQYMSKQWCTEDDYQRQREDLTSKHCDGRAQRLEKDRHGHLQG